MTHPYSSETYAQAFAGLAEPLACAALGTYVLKRAIPDSPQFDAMGCYPLAAIAPAADIPAAIDQLRAAGMVSLVLVADAFHGPAFGALRQHFDPARPYKQHYVHDYALAFDYDKHHRYEVRRARADCEVLSVEYAAHRKRWEALYAELVTRRSIKGLQRFSPHYFGRLARMTGLHSLAAHHSGTVVAMHLFIEHDGIVYSHLAASSDEGYRLRAGYALNDFAIEYFRGRRLIDFGAGAGIADDPSGGLAAFKQGFANRTEPVYLYGRILDAGAYEKLSAGRRRDGFFPAYRSAANQSGN